MRLRDLPPAMPVKEFEGTEMCHNWFWALDRCMEYGAAAERPKQPFARYVHNIHSQSLSKFEVAKFS
jgi:hypothetical protein